MKPEAKPRGESVYPILGYAIVAASLVPIPFHKMMSCDMSGTVAGLSILTVPITIILGFLTPKEAGGRFMPFVAAVFAAFVHPLFAH